MSNKIYRYFYDKLKNSVLDSGHDVKAVQKYQKFEVPRFTGDVIYYNIIDNYNICQPKKEYLDNGNLNITSKMFTVFQVEMYGKNVIDKIQDIYNIMHSKYYEGIIRSSNIKEINYLNERKYYEQVLTFDATLEHDRVTTISYDKIEKYEYIGGIEI